LSFVAAESDLEVTASQSGQTLSLAARYGNGPDSGLPYLQTADIILTLQVDPTFGGGNLTVTGVAETPGLPITPGANQASTSFNVFSPTAVLNSFAVRSVHSGVELAWTTEAEFNSLGFYVERGLQSGGPFTRLTAIGLVPAVGSGAAGADYVVVDGAAARGQTYWYRLVERKTAGILPAERVLLDDVRFITFNPPPWKLYLPLLERP
jgi:hypothetical protein